MIRRAEKKDIPAIMRMLHQVNDVHAEGRPDLFVKGHTKYTETEVERIITDEATPVFVSTDENDTAVGYGFCIVHDHTKDKHLAPIKTLYIDDICIDSEHRGQHIGSGIYRHVRDYAKSTGCHNVTLNVWACNPEAMAFYDKMGLKPFKTGMEEVL